MHNYFMVFDVESIGLHGEAFAVAWVVVNRNGQIIDEGCMACDPSLCKGTDENRLWVKQNVPEILINSPSKLYLRRRFWEVWLYWKGEGAVLVSDCGWPVEANFLSACVNDNITEREWQGPYPLYDLSSVMLTLGKNPLTSNERLLNELPAHHPLMDARQSARLLIECLKERGGIL